VADLGTLELGTLADSPSVSLQGSEPVLEAIASADDADYVFDAANSTHTASARFSLGDTPADLGNVDTISIRLRYGLGAAPDNNTWDSLTAQIVESDGDTGLTDAVTVVSGPIEDTDPTNSSVVALTNPDTGASKATWDAARVKLGFNVTKNKGGDTIQKRVYAAEVTGTYTIASGQEFQQSCPAVVAAIAQVIKETQTTEAVTVAAVASITKRTATTKAAVTANVGALTSSFIFLQTAAAVTANVAALATAITWSQVCAAVVSATATVGRHTSKTLAAVVAGAASVKRHTTKTFAAVGAAVAGLATEYAAGGGGGDGPHRIGSSRGVRAVVVTVMHRRTRSRR
jgi:hypothetical protein